MRMYGRLALIAAMLGLVAPARADTTAIYTNAAANFSMTIKIAANGDVHGEIPGQAYYSVGGQDYFVQPTDHGPEVVALADITKVMAEKWAKMGAAPFTPPSLTILAKGTVAIKQWSGDAFYMQDSRGQVSAHLVVVISHDPTLAALGQAMKRQFDKSESMMNQIMGRAPNSNMAQVLSLGAPIAFAGAELQSVNFESIPKAEFVLPGPPMSLDDVRKKLAPH